MRRRATRRRGSARDVCASLSRALLADGIDVVVVETDAPRLFDGALHVTLTAPVDAALERVQPTQRVESPATRRSSGATTSYTSPPRSPTIDTAETAL